jgi:hypothetical protein
MISLARRRLAGADDPDILAAVGMDDFIKVVRKL